MSSDGDGGREASADVSIWHLIQKYLDETGATEASVLRRANLNKGLFSAWRARGVPALPTRAQLLAIAEAIKTPYEEVLEAALHDCRYLPEEAARAADRELQENVALLKGGGAHESDSGRAAANTRPGSSPDSPPAPLRVVHAAASTRMGEPSVSKRRRRQDEAAEASQDDGSMEPS